MATKAQTSFTQGKSVAGGLSTLSRYGGSMRLFLLAMLLVAVATTEPVAAQNARDICEQGCMDKHFNSHPTIFQTPPNSPERLAASSNVKACIAACPTLTPAANYDPGYDLEDMPRQAGIYKCDENPDSAQCIEIRKRTADLSKKGSVGSDQPATSPAAQSNTPVVPEGDQTGPIASDPAKNGATTPGAEGYADGEAEALVANKTCKPGMTKVREVTVEEICGGVEYMKTLDANSLRQCQDEASQMNANRRELNRWVDECANSH